MLGGGEVPGRAWWRALCLNSSGPRLDSAVETVPTTMAPETMALETMAPETLVPEEIAPSNPKVLGLTISMASVPAPRRRQVSAWVGAGSMQSAPLRATPGSSEAGGGATAN